MGMGNRIEHEREREERLERVRQQKERERKGRGKGLYSPRLFWWCVVIATAFSMAGFGPAVWMAYNTGRWSLNPLREFRPSHVLYPNLAIHLVTVVLWVPLALFQLLGSGPCALAKGRKDTWARFHVMVGWFGMFLVAVASIHGVSILFQPQIQVRGPPRHGSSHTGAAAILTGIIAAFHCMAAVKAVRSHRFAKHTLHMLAAFTCSLYPGATRVAAHFTQVYLIDNDRKCDVLHTGGLVLTPAALVLAALLYGMALGALGPNSPPRRRAVKFYGTGLVVLVVSDILFGYFTDSLLGCHWVDDGTIA